VTKNLHTRFCDEPDSGSIDALSISRFLSLALIRVNHPPASGLSNMEARHQLRQSGRCICQSSDFPGRQLYALPSQPRLRFPRGRVLNIKLTTCRNDRPGYGTASIRILLSNVRLQPLSLGLASATCIHYSQRPNQNAFARFLPDTIDGAS
jgi:hypothetical protein